MLRRRADSMIMGSFGRYLVETAHDHESKRHGVGFGGW